MKASHVKNTDPAILKRGPIVAAVMLALATPFSADVALANSAFGSKTDIAGNLVDVPTFFASSPSGLQPAYDPAIHGLSPSLKVDTGKALRKFVDPIGGAANGLDPNGGDLTSGIPVAIPEKWVNLSGSVTSDDYYEIAIVEYTEQMHSDLAKPTRLRGYVQIETANIYKNNIKDAAGVASEHIPATYPDGTPILDLTGNAVFFTHKPHYLGPAIVASRGTPVRIKFTNYLPFTNAAGASVGTRPVAGVTGGELFIPVDETIPGGGPVIDGLGNQIFAKNLDGSPMMHGGLPVPVKMGQNRASIHWHGGDTPWISDGTPHQWFAPAGDISYNIGIDADHPQGMGRGVSAINVPDMADPGQGSYTAYFPNNLSGRMMWYHDHTSGLTRLNAYVGMAAGYLVVDPVEQALVGNALGATATALDKIGTPLVFQDKGFVPKNVGPNAVASDGSTPASQDAKWDATHWGQEGDLFFPHVYETNQDPNSIDGTNPVGRWDWGPWFWPVFPAQYSLPTGAYGDVTTTPEAFMDTALVNGKAYPTMTVEPKAYRLRILSAANDRTLNLNMFQAVDAAGKLCDAANTNPAIAPTAPGGVAPMPCTELKMVPALPTPGFPANWPTDGRAGGVPDPATAGPTFVQIGNEGGLLPAAAAFPAQPITYDTNVQSITVFNVLHHGLLLGGAERADVLVDFTNFAGKTLIVYNDAPAPMPGFDPRIDYYTGMGDNTSAGGAFDPLPGYGPNTRTFMQIKVGNTVSSGGPLNTAALSAMPSAYAQTQPKPNIPQAVYNAAFGTKSTFSNYASIGTGSRATNGLYSYTDEAGNVQTLPVINKAIQELFDPTYGRMNATLAAELPLSSATVATTIPLSYVDAPVESLDAIAEGQTQIWKITHNGVDDHPVHFHLVNVQVLNRVGWDGKIKAPDANEVGWKETVRMNPLEDVYLAVRATKPVAPFGVPTSGRLLDPAQAAGGTLGFTPISPVTGQAPAVAPSNVVASFDNEYVWHCHILGHEEFDFMRPFVFHPTVLVPDAPGLVAADTNLHTVTWQDPTPVGGSDAQGIPTAGTNAAYLEPTSSPKNEVGFKITVPAAPGSVFYAPANATSWADPSNPPLDLTGATVVAYNAAGDSLPGVAAPLAAPVIVPVVPPAPIVSAPAPALAGATGPTNLTVAATGTAAAPSATLTWTGVAGATGYTVNGALVPAANCVTNAATGVTTCTYVPALGAGLNTYDVAALTPNGATAVASTTMFNGKAYDPVAFTAAAGPVVPVVSSIVLNWANSPLNLNNVTGLVLTWTRQGTNTATNGSATFAPTATGATIINLADDQTYRFTLQAISPNGSSNVITTSTLSSKIL